MIEILNGSISPAHQTILALEMLPPSVNISGFDVVHLTEKRQLLNEKDFKEVEFLSAHLQSMHKAIATKKSERKSERNSDSK